MVARDATALYTSPELIFATVGAPRRVWSLLLPLDTGWPLFAGAVVRLTRSTVRAYGVVGVSGVFGRITSIRFDLEAAEVEVAISHTGARGAGWNAALEVIGIGDPKTVTVSTTRYVPAEHPATGAPLSALDLWAVGDSVLIRPTGDHDSAVSAKITGLDGPKVTFDNDHGLGPPHFGVIESSVYGLAGDTHTQLAYLADDDGALGPGDDPGHQPG